jgi:starch-binding outer membrane protein SusE/F
MKNIIKTLFLTSLITAISSCENDKEPIVSANGFELRKEASVVSPLILTETINADSFTKLNWDKSDNGVASVSTYSLVIFDHDNDPNLENGVEYSGTTAVVVTPESRTAELTVVEFNDLINQLSTFKCSQMNIDIRIKSTLGIKDKYTTPLIQYSNPITYAVTGYPKSLPILAFVKGSEVVENAPKIAASAPGINTDFEGYIYLKTGSYKFYEADACGDFTGAPAYGGSAGTINTDASAPSIEITTEGHYLVRANLTAKSYTVSQFRTFGVFGNGTRVGLGIGNAVPFTYDETKKVWKRTVELIKGRTIGFKSNLWTGEEVIPALPNTNNNPPFIPAAGTATISILGKGNTDSDAIDLPLLPIPPSPNGSILVPGIYDANARQKYDIELDVSNPRKYTYKLILNSN